jgi:hypothetical protein
MKIFGLVIILLCSLFLTQSVAQEALPNGYQYVFPGQDSRYIHPNSTIILRFENISPQDLGNLSTLIKVSGENSGHHMGTTFIASDNRTIIFESENSYELGEKVEVTIDPRLSQSIDNMISPFSFKFTVLEEGIATNSVPEERIINSSGQKKSATIRSAQLQYDFQHIW